LTTARPKSPQTNGICERFHRTVQEEFYAVAFRKKIYRTIPELQQDLDKWIADYNTKRTHSGKYCFAKTPMQTFIDSITLAKEKLLEQLHDNIFSTNPSSPEPTEGWQKKYAFKLKPKELYLREESDNS
jgi:hypothetical protein